MDKSITLSVHQLVDFLLRSGDIDNRVFNRSSMSEGTRLHAVYQSEQDNSTYMSEYPLKQDLLINEIPVTLEGRADGIIKGKDYYIIDEIKTTVMDLEEFERENLDWHLGQAKCYAYLFAKEQHLPVMGVRLTYIKQGKTKEKHIDNYFYIFEELENYVLSLLDEYLDFYEKMIFNHLENRRVSIKSLKFPFEKYRRGQRNLSKLVYGVATKGGRLFVEAPTGIGKTMSTLFPYIKAIEEDEHAKIFYLTAKNSGKEAAYNAVKVLLASGLDIFSVIITAREKICFSKGKACNPDECPFAKGYYNKVKSAITYALSLYKTLDVIAIKEIAQNFEICPFELQLDLSLFVDVIICDYNYMFDPMAYLRRYFDSDASHHLVLVDEAHNLVDRSKEMYSSEMNIETLLLARKSVRHIKSRKIKNALKKVKDVYDYFAEFTDEITVHDELPEEVYKALNSAYTSLQEVSKEEHTLITKEITNLILEINQFLKINDFFNDRFIFYSENKNGNIKLRIFCLDASKFLQAISKEVKATTYFSATLQPIEYYINTLGGEVNEPYSLLTSPFPKDNLLVLIASKVSIRYKNRESSYAQVAEYIKEFVANKVGNYFIYVPSYEYLERIKDYLDLPNEYNLLFQERDMDDIAKEEFLLNFVHEPTNTTLGFLVIGGAFSEGIDLTNDRLIGAIIVGVGLPRINFESDKLKEFYDLHELNGYDYAYLYPGFNKIMQAVGRVIRSEEDKGAVLLIDERYMYNDYKELFRDEWSDYKVVFSPKQVSAYIKDFYRKK